MTAVEPAGSALPGLAEYLAAASPVLEWIRRRGGGAAGSGAPSGVV